MPQGCHGYIYYLPVDVDINHFSNPVVVRGIFDGDGVAPSEAADPVEDWSDATDKNVEGCFWLTKSNVAFLSATPVNPISSDIAETAPDASIGAGWCTMRPSRPHMWARPPYSPNVAFLGPDPKSPPCGLPKDLKLLSFAAFSALRAFFGDGASAWFSFGTCKGESHFTERTRRGPRPVGLVSLLLPSNTLFNRKADERAFCILGDSLADCGEDDKLSALRNFDRPDVN